VVYDDTTSFVCLSVDVSISLVILRPLRSRFWVFLSRPRFLRRNFVIGDYAISDFLLLLAGLSCTREWWTAELCVDIFRFFGCSFQ